MSEEGSFILNLLLCHEGIFFHGMFWKKNNCLLVAGLAFFLAERYFSPAIGKNLGEKVCLF